MLRMLPFLYLFACIAWADMNHSEVVVIETRPELQDRFNELSEVFRQKGTSAVVDSIQRDTKNEENLQKWREFAARGDVHVVEVKVHPNETAAVEWMNK